MKKAIASVIYVLPTSINGIHVPRRSTVALQIKFDLIFSQWLLLNSCMNELIQDRGMDSDCVALIELSRHCLNPTWPRLLWLGRITSLQNCEVQQKHVKCTQSFLVNVGAGDQRGQKQSPKTKTKK